MVLSNTIQINAEEITNYSCDLSKGGFLNACSITCSHVVTEHWFINFIVRKPTQDSMTFFLFCLKRARFSPKKFREVANVT